MLVPVTVLGYRDVELFYVKSVVRNMSQNWVQVASGCNGINSVGINVCIQRFL